FTSSSYLSAARSKYAAASYVCASPSSASRRSCTFEPAYFSTRLHVVIAAPRLPAVRKHAAACAALSSDFGSSGALLYASKKPVPSGRGFGSALGGASWIAFPLGAPSSFFNVPLTGPAAAVAATSTSASASLATKLHLQAAAIGLAHDHDVAVAQLRA